MGMSGYIMDLEEKFYDDVSEIVKESDSYQEAETKVLEKAKVDVPFLDRDDVIECVSHFWYDFWSKCAGS